MPLNYNYSEKVALRNILSTLALSIPHSDAAPAPNEWATLFFVNLNFFIKLAYE